MQVFLHIDAFMYSYLILVLFKQIYSTRRWEKLTKTTIQVQSEPSNNGNEEVLHTHHQIHFSVPTSLVWFWFGFMAYQLL